MIDPLAPIINLSVDGTLEFHPHSTISITSSTTIIGNVTLPASSTINLPLPSTTNSPPLVIAGCATLQGTVTVTLTETEI